VLHGSVVQLELAERVQRSHERLSQLWPGFEHGQALGCGLQGAEAALGGLGADDVVADAHCDEFHLFLLPVSLAKCFDRYI